VRAARSCSFSLPPLSSSGGNGNGALQEYRKANATYDIGTAERLREKILGAKGKL